MMRPGGCSSRRMENAVTDLPLPDSPTSPSVSPAAIWKLTWSTAVTVRAGPVEDDGQILDVEQRSRHHIGALILAEDAAQRVGDLAEGRALLDGGDDRRHQIVAAARRLRRRRRAPAATPVRCAPARTARTRSICCLLHLGIDAEDLDAAGRPLSSVYLLTPTTTAAPASIACWARYADS